MSHQSTTKTTLGQMRNSVEFRIDELKRTIERYKISGLDAKYMHGEFLQKTLAINVELYKCLVEMIGKRGEHGII